MKPVRCAIYTRKSSDEGLEQDFNSLDAQREACEAYVLSQASEGWKLHTQRYDDGGLSGGTLERPALQRLLADIEAGRIEIVVVYKVDRLTRSLLDFAKLVDTFDAHQTSFVSVTQSFNTTNSMGRLTLNMLLSFAQFEREVTAERIRDKIAASKAKGMWMGGTPPLGYEPDGRSLRIVEDHAAIIRDIYRRYLEVKNVRLVAESLQNEGITSPVRISQKGKSHGGCPFSRGQLYTILKNPVYAGDIAHKGKVHPGNHQAIIARAQWDAVQAQLSDNLRGQRRIRDANASLLAGLLVDAEGEPLVAVHSTKGNRRYRYYVSKAHQHQTARPGTQALRLPAREIEQVVTKELATLFANPVALLDVLQLPASPDLLDKVSMTCTGLAPRLDPVVLWKLIAKIAVHPDRIVITFCGEGFAEALGLPEGHAPSPALSHVVPVRLANTGRRVRLVHENGLAANGCPDPVLVRLLVKAHRWWAILAQGKIDIASLARDENVTASYVTRVVRLAFLAPPIVAAILDGSIRADVDSKAMLATGAIPESWDEQARKFLPT